MCAGLSKRNFCWPVGTAGTQQASSPVVTAQTGEATNESAADRG